MSQERLVVVRRVLGPPPLLLRLSAVLLVPLLLYALVATGNKALVNYHLNREADGLRAEVLGLRDQNIALQREIEQARGDAAIEGIARDQLNLVRPGDRPVVIVANQPAPDTRPSTPATNAPPPPPWRQWWDVFFR